MHRFARLGLSAALPHATPRPLRFAVAVPQMRFVHSGHVAAYVVRASVPAIVPVVRSWPAMPVIVPQRRPANVEKWSSNDVGSWLAECGVSPEGIAVCTETVGGAVLADLTRRELEDIGVRTADRLKILQGVSKLPSRRREGPGQSAGHAEQLIEPVRKADEEAFEADYNAVWQDRLDRLRLTQQRRKPRAKQRQRREQSSVALSVEHKEDGRVVRVVDVCLSRHELRHFTFAHIRDSTQLLLSLPLGDSCTAAFSTSGPGARSIQKHLLSYEARIRRNAEEELMGTLEDPKAMVTAFPALHYLGLKRMGKMPTALTAAHKQRLVSYGEGVLRCLTTEIQPTLKDLKPCFKHHLTCDLDFVAGLPRAYTQRCRAAVEELEARLQTRKSPIKENDPVYVIASLPRMGKSLLLQDLARYLDGKGKRVACITYNGDTLVRHDDTASVEGAISGFFVRLLMACVFPAQLHSNVRDELESLRKRSMWIGDFKAVMRKLGLPVPEVVFVDEFTKLLDKFAEDDQRAIIDGIVQLSASSKLVFSGFVTSFTPKLVHASGRPAVTHFFELPPVSAECLEDFRVRLAPHRALMMEISPLLYLSCQNSPGLLGHLFETMTKDSVLLPPLSWLLSSATESKREQLVEWLRDLTTKELCGGGTKPEKFADAQREAVALVVNENTTVAHPFAFATVLGSMNETLSSSCSGGAVLENLPHQKALLTDLVQQLSVLSRTMHDTCEELVRTDDNDEVLEVKLRATKCEYLEVATYHARALRMLAKYQHSGNVELDPKCDLHVAKGESGATDSTDHANMADRIEVVSAGLDSLQERNIGAFVWRLKADGEAVAGVVEGEFTDGRWSITFTDVPVDAMRTFKDTIELVPCPLEDCGRIASVELVFLCPGATIGKREDTVAGQDEVEKTKIGVPSKHPFKTRILADSVGVRQHLSTPIASLLPTGPFQGPRALTAPSHP